MTGAAAGGAAPYYRSPSGDVVLWQGDALTTLAALPAGSVHTVITSPPYFALRDYGTAVWEGGDSACEHQARDKSRGVTSDARLGYVRESETYRAVCGKCGARRVDAQLGLEATVGEYVENLAAVFREVRRVLHPSGCLWLNCGDSYAANGSGSLEGGSLDKGGRQVGHNRGFGRPSFAGAKAKDLLMIPARVAIALRDDGWWLRAMIPWLKRSAMPESATDRPTTATEYVFLLSKASSYYYDADATRIRTGNELSWEEYQERTAPGAAFRGPERANGVQVVHAGSNKHDGGRSHPAGRNRRNVDWWFDSLRAILAGATGLLADEDGAPLALPVNPEAYPGAHFATFPRRLVEPMLLASTSARGACGKCGAPWVRTTEREFVQTGPVRQADETDASSGWPGFPRGVTRSETTGWRAGCACEDAGDPVPCVVLDPFAGACTTGLVARKHGRRFIGVDLSAAYLELARERLGQLALPGLVAD